MKDTAIKILDKIRIALKKAAGAVKKCAAKLLLWIKECCSELAEKRIDLRKWLQQDKKPRKYAIAAGTLCIFLLVFVFIMYGPYKGLSDLYITTAMHTSDHQYLATMLYSDEYIARVLERNGIIEKLGVSEPQRSESSSDIEYINIEDFGLSGHLIIVSDASRMDIVPTVHGSSDLLENIADSYDAIAAINASGYVSNKYSEVPNGLVIYNHEVVHECDGLLHSFFAIADDGSLFFGSMTAEEILAHNFRALVDFGPLLILNGELSKIEGYGTGFSARTAIGQTADGKVLMLVIDGMQQGALGATLAQVQEIMLSYGAVNAIALDGGSSSSMYYEGKIVNSPSQGDRGRFIPNAVIVR